jgi:hypothetical protein
LVFWKVPGGERGVGVRGLFLVRSRGVGEEGDDVEGDGGDGNDVEGEGGEEAREGKGDGEGKKRKRAFWGRETHPDLSLWKKGEEKVVVVEGGSVEGLVHEVVFGTTFFTSPARERGDGGDGGDDDGREREWREFTSSVLFALPLLKIGSGTGRERVEGEVMRCCGYYLSGFPTSASTPTFTESSGPTESSEDVEMKKARERVRWLVREYARLSGCAGGCGGVEWGAWKREILGELESERSGEGVGATRRRDRDRDRAGFVLEGCLGRLGLGSSFWTALEHGQGKGQGRGVGGDGLSLFSGVDLRVVVRSLGVFHRAAVENLMDGHERDDGDGCGDGDEGCECGDGCLTVDVVLSSPLSPPSSTQAQTQTQQLQPTQTQNRTRRRTSRRGALKVLVGGDEELHWLTRFVLWEIFGAGAGGGGGGQHSQHSGGSGNGSVSGGGNNNWVHSIPTTTTTTTPTVGCNVGSGGVSVGVGGVGAHHHASSSSIGHVLGLPRGYDERDVRTTTITNTTTMGMRSTRPGPPPPQPQRTTRSGVISMWVRVGEMCRVGGDECSWRAIMEAVCSRAVVRLNGAWRGVEGDVLRIVEAWVACGDGGGGGGDGVDQPRVTVWGGDVRRRIESALEFAEGEGNGGKVRVEGLEKAWILFEDLRKGIEGCLSEDATASARASLLLGVEEDEGEESEMDGDVRRLVELWKDVVLGGVGNSSRFVRCVFSVVNSSLPLIDCHLCVIASISS